MKILVIQDYLRSGGTEHQSILLTRAFREAGHHARLLTFRPGGTLAPRAADLPVVCLQPFDTRLDWFAPELKRSVRRFEPEVVLCMGRMANGYAGFIQDWIPSATVVATMRTGKPLPWLFRRSLRRVPHIIANSGEARDTLVREHALPAGKISVIHNALVCASPEERTSREPLRAAQQATVGTTVLLSVAMFRPEKGQRELIATAAELPPELNWQLWLAGEGATLAACRKLADQLGIGSRVRFLGWQRNPGAFYQAADIAVHASRSEALSNFLIEAQFHGLPAVAYAAQGIAECFIPGVTGTLVPRGERTNFVSAVVRYARASTSEREACTMRARAFAKDRFDPIRQARSFLDLFERLRTTPS